MSLNHAPQPDPDNILDLAQQICKDGEESSPELEQKRKIAARVTEIIMARLDRDALRIEEQAIVGNGTIQQRHQLMDLARCLRTTMTWIAGPPAEKANLS